MEDRDKRFFIWTQPSLPKDGDIEGADHKPVRRDAPRWQCLWLTLSGSPPQGGESRPTARSDFALRHAFAISPRIFARVLRSNLPPRDQRAQGMPGARCARSLVCEIKKHTSIVTTVTPESPGIPRAMVLTVSFALSSVTGLSCHRRLQVTTCKA